MFSGGRIEEQRVAAAYRTGKKEEWMRIYGDLMEKEWRAAYMVEAAVIMPLYAGMAAAIFLFFHVFTMSWGIFTTANEIARETALLGDAEADKLLAADFALAEAKLAGEGLPFRHVRGGIFGINFTASSVDEQDIRLIASYTMPLPVHMFRIRNFTAATCVRARRWVGYDPHEGENGTGSVYVTEYGRVYHTTKDCPYLDLSIHSVGMSEVNNRRNASGGKYYRCPICKGKGEIVYITDYGTNYHGSIGCSGLKRTIHQMTEKEARERGYGACSKCGR